ncbi:MAG TPA: hypothetical protein VGM03_12825 [Phycisphaerae bacterium]
MLRRRKILLVISLVLVPGSLAATGGYAAYLHSDSYRLRTEQRLSALLTLPLQLGRILPLSLSSRELSDIEVFLPRRQARVFACRRAVWQEGPRDGRPYGVLVLADGTLTAGDEGWDRADYEQMLRTGLGQDFARLDLGEVHISGMDIAWRGRTLGLHVGDASGVILFDSDGSGQASLSAHSLNDCAVASPINIAAHFTPGRAMALHEVVLTVPRIALSALRLPGWVDQRSALGWFKGAVTYAESAEGQRIIFAGALDEANLESLTAGVIGGPFHGRVDIDLQEANFLDRRLSALRFRGRLSGLRLSEIAPGLESPQAEAELRIQQAALTPERIETLSASGKVADVSFEAVTRMFGRGIITGKLKVVIEALQIQDDHIHYADISLYAVPPAGEAGSIDRDVLISAAKDLLGIDISKVLPAMIQKVEYAQMGAHLIIEGTNLRVRGTHGPDNDTLVTVKLLGREWGIIKAPERIFTIPDLIALARQRLAPYGHDYQRVRDWWERHHPEE